MLLFVKEERIKNPVVIISLAVNLIFILINLLVSIFIPIAYKRLILSFIDEEDEKKFEEEWKKEQIETREVRGTWKHSLDFLFSCISVSVGLGSKYRCHSRIKSSFQTNSIAR